jgi:hypothetical protein
MRAEQIPAEELAPLSGNYWRFIDDSGEVDVVAIDRAALPTDVMEAGAAIVVLQAILDAPPAEPAPVAATISKDAIWRRATDAEAEAMEAALAAQPVRVRRIYDGASYISTGDELFSLLEAALVGLFGAERAAELLAPTA